MKAGDVYLKVKDRYDITVYRIKEVRQDDCQAEYIKISTYEMFYSEFADTFTISEMTSLGQIKSSVFDELLDIQKNYLEEIRTVLEMDAYETDMEIEVGEIYTDDTYIFQIDSEEDNKWGYWYLMMDEDHLVFEEKWGECPKDKFGRYIHHITDYSLTRINELKEQLLDDIVKSIWGV